jgi:hypothetical protein
MQPGWNSIEISPAHGAGKWTGRTRIVAFLLAMSAVAVPCDFSQAPQATATQPRQMIIDPAANRPPDKNEQMEINERNATKATYEAANAERKRQLADDSAALLQLSNELKAELDKTTKDTLSLDVVRKADEIARLAHNVQVKMKLTVNAAY